MDDRKTISCAQLLALGGAAALSPALRLYPAASAAIAGRAAWLSALCCLPVLLGYAWVFCRLAAARRAGEGMGELLLRALGNTIGKAVLLLYGLWLLLYAGFVLRAAAARFTVALFPQSDPAFFVLTLGALCLVASLSPPRALARTARLLFPLLLGVILLLLLVSLRQIDAENLLPLRTEDALPALRGALPVGEVLLVGLYVPGFLLGAVPARGGSFRAVGLWLLGMCLLLAALCAAVLGCFGAEITASLTLPFFTLVRNLVFFRTLERVEALVVALWLFPDFLLGTLALLAAQRCLRPVAALPALEKNALLRGGRWLFFVGGALAIAAGLWLAPNETALTLWSETIIPVGQYIAAGALPLLLALGRKEVASGQ